MVQRLAFFLFAAALAVNTAAAATPKLSGHPGKTEVAFVKAVQADLPKRFATAADAERAGYFRFSNEDDTGAISYANLQWQSTDADHPSELWYDVNGKLIGADYTVLRTNSPKAPHLWGITPARWLEFKKPHVHFILKKADGSLQYGMATSAEKFTAAGGDLANPSADALVKVPMKTMKIASASDVQKVFIFPALWDLQVWVVPNPKGAFAEKNPNVVPSKTAEKGEM